MSSTYGENLKLSIFGQSHGPAIGMTLDGIPAGNFIDFDKLQAFLNRRAPGQNNWSTPRTESDRPEFLSGVMDGYTCGAPIAAVIYNQNTRSVDYDELKDIPRPGHADLTAQYKYGGFQDTAGGGHFSGRLTAPLCIAGGMCLQWLKAMGITVKAYIQQIGEICDSADTSEIKLCSDFPARNSQTASLMQQCIAEARSRGDSVGGKITCVISGLPVGLGEPMFGGVESRIAQLVYGIPAVKGLTFGDTQNYGSENNDAYYVKNGQVLTATNHCGGILGGITNGMPVVFTTALKPTPSIALPQQSISLTTGEITTLQVKGRHDPCIIPRAVPVIEAAAAIAIYDLILGNTQANRRK